MEQDHYPLSLAQIEKIKHFYQGYEHVTIHIAKGRGNTKTAVVVTCSDSREDRVIDWWGAVIQGSELRSGGWKPGGGSGPAGEGT